jgi:hypothetical protein
MTSLRRELAVFAVALAAACGALAAPAWAGNYTVTSCLDRAGRPTPASDAAGGWRSLGTGPGRSAEDLCASGTPRLVASIGGQWSFPVPTVVEWRFTAPPNTYLAAFSLVYSG